MPRADIVNRVHIARTARVMQIEGLFEIPPATESRLAWSVELPLEERPWNIGLIVGPSGCGKSTIARTLFGDCLRSEFEWPRRRSVVDAFPREMGIKQIAALLASVGFSSPPSWLRPFHCLSSGEQFRVTLARALAEQGPLTVIDEFSSLVDRTVAQIGSAAVARCVRRSGKQLIAVSCHRDIVDWLAPDWIYEPASDQFQWRDLRRRPRVVLEIARVHRAAWKLLQRHHYLSSELNPAAKCFVAFIAGRPVAFTAVLPFPHPRRPGWREHRTVCLPDFQGIGIGNALSDFVASLFRATGKPYWSTTSNPAMIASRRGSKSWKLIRKPGRIARRHQGSLTSLSRSGSQRRMTASFEYSGPADLREAIGCGLIPIPGERPA